MNKQFWQQRWQENRIGFHLAQTNPLLTQNFSRLSLEKELGVFVPLCGKTLDMIWLRNQGYRVVGVEISELAVRSFFTENKLIFAQRREGDFEVYTAEGITLYVGDFFSIRPEYVSGCGAVYDRAALVALPPEMRRQYASYLKQILLAPILLVSMEYDQRYMSGPPFSVSRAEIESLYRDQYEIEVILETSASQDDARLKERGLVSLKEFVSLLLPKYV
ncbi:MAG: thiopurine S-methyltransferase [Gammaproteobacteria bacterium]|nr:thiopurine S-methyltransferase [Gammaproteobacteria bacterium]